MKKEQVISRDVDVDDFGETAALSKQPTESKTDDRIMPVVREQTPDPTMFVTLPRAELQLILKRQEELEAMVKQDQEERQKLREEMEATAQKDREEREKQREEMDAAIKTLQVGAIVSGRSVISHLDMEEEPSNSELASLVDKELKIPESSLPTSKNFQSYRSLAMSDDGQEIEWHTPFGGSVYTLLYMCDVQSQGFWYAMFVIAIQVITILLTMVSVLDLDAQDHLITLPAMVDPLVTVTQGVTLFLALAFQSDLIEAVLKLQEGYDPKVLLSHPGADLFTWSLSVLCQFLAGSLLLLTIFVLTMGAEDVLSIMLNFAALNFLSHVDDLGFSLAEMGFVTNQLQETVAAMANFKVPKRKTLNRSRRIFYLLTLIGLFVGFGILKKRQLDGEYLPTYIYVQFGDSYNPRIPFYSGILKAEDTITAHRRSYRDYSTGNVLLAYCVEEKAWTFTENSDDPCHYHFAKSAETTTYVVTSISDAEWQVKDSLGRLQPFDSFSLVDRDCNPGTCQGTCGDDGLCQCGPNTFGIDCEFIDVCPQLVADARYEAFPAVKYIPSENPWRDYDAAAVGNAFDLLKNPNTGAYVRVYNMPVYYSNQTFPANIIFFGGRRWIVTSEWGLFNMWEAQNQKPDEWFFINSTVATLENGFHGFHKAQYTPLFISDPVDFKTPNFLPTPAGLRWWHVKAIDKDNRLYEPDAPVETILTCPDTRFSCIGAGEYFCQNEGICNNGTGVCDCTGSFTGNRCELEEACYGTEDPCSHNGVCDHGNGASGFCRCNLPWYGKLCKEWYKCYEENGECKSGGTCNMVTGDCECPDDPAISGHACEKRADCIFFGCANGGYCPGWQGECVCPSPFYGAHCELVDSSQEEILCSQDNDCVNGTCNTETGICACNDPASHGTLCESQFNCTKVILENGDWQPVCLNLGTCNDDSGICDCPHPYSGPDCSHVPPCLSDDDCDNEGGGTCDLESGKCDCVLGPAAGNRCERQPWCTTDADCNAGGCDPYYGTCRCPIGSGGRFCESLIVGMYPSYWDDQIQSDRETIGQYGFEALWNCEGGSGEICDLLT